MKIMVIIETAFNIFDAKRNTKLLFKYLPQSEFDANHGPRSP